uniref:NADH dehydrogenase subunit 4L n=1 Tax=Alboglossiphonia lata TaxID=321034 RepID=UPI0023D88F14|nr:NADH dehydrogenase subunit 4L [Alboglossiphonia lata]WDA96093.1 NADH dehydrogenase subunit 4L [Alboglossiphonia lata]
MSYLMITVAIIPMIAILNLILYKNYFLLILLCLEVIMLSMLLFLCVMFMIFNMNPSMMSVIILTLGACEASLGLTLLSMMVRFFGNDMIKNISLSKC